MDCSLQGSSVHVILQAKIARLLEYVAIPFSRPLGDLPNPGIKPRSPALHIDSIPSEPSGKPIKSLWFTYYGKELLQWYVPFNEVHKPPGGMEQGTQAVLELGGLGEGCFSLASGS